MARKTVTPLGAVLMGISAGAAGTAAMDLVWYRRYQMSGAEDDPKARATTFPQVLDGAA